MHIAQRDQQRIRLSISGQVQGVGFRPYIYHLANQSRLTGWVMNTSDGVLIEAQGTATQDFLCKIKLNLPPLAQIDKIKIKKLMLVAHETDFAIFPSQKGLVTTRLVPDAATCDMCLNELFDPQSHFYRYPFLNCTYCGPRYSITHQLPYDRSQTSMAKFTMCTQCSQAYHQPNNRRFHAQPIACNNCGPQLSHTIESIAQAIRKGNIVAVKGMGGYQLICDANNESTVLQLRQRKNRPAKPFAIMLLNNVSVKHIAICNALEAKLLENWHRPIVLLKKKGQPLASSIAPGLQNIGIMLPCTPIHYLIFHALLRFPKGVEWLTESCSIALVVTSANFSEQPLITEDQLAKKELKKIADKTICYNRIIVNRNDDSVLQMIDTKTPMFIRRARSYAPNPVNLGQQLPSVLALGSYFKNTFCVIRGKEAFISPHLGDMKNGKTIQFFHDTLAYYLKVFDIKPVAIAHDCHPDLYVSQIANKFGLPTYSIQHHHAHLGAVAAEYHISHPVLGLILDGLGYGLDGTFWGGELLLMNHIDIIRLGHLKPILQPGGDLAVREPWRMAASVLYELGLTKEIKKYFPDKEFIITMMTKKINTFSTSSCGRLFDAASALLGLILYSDYEAQAAMVLESNVTKLVTIKDGWEIKNNILNLLPLFTKLIQCNPEQGANLFHGTLIHALTTWIQSIAIPMKIKTILLSGGCFHNKILAKGLLNSLRAIGLKPLLPRQVPPNDGGLSLGQAWLAGLRHRGAL